MATIATLFSGGEGVGVGARAAGLSHLFGIEYDDAIANVARANGFHVITADVMSIDPHTLEVPDVLHASPVCKRASNANQSAELNEDGTKEAPEDIAAGQKIAEFIDVMTPKVFTLENVYAYRNFKAFKIICNALNRGGYMWDFDNLNAADYGVPQTRRRLILRAVRGSLLPNLPQSERWVGWYESIEDLIPMLPESQFATWQLARLPEEITESPITRPAKFNPAEERGNGYYFAEQLAPTVMPYNSVQRAFILDCQKSGDTGHWECGNCGYKWQEPQKPVTCPKCNQDDIGWNDERGVTLPQGDAPMFTVTNGKGKRQPLRAYLVDDQRTTDGSPTSRDENEPSFPILAGVNHPVRAYLVSSLDCTTRDGDEPANTFVSVGDGHSIPPKAYLVDGDGTRSRQPTTLNNDEPSMTIQTWHGRRPTQLPRAWLSQGRVVAMTPRALARFQSFPDSYLLPDNRALACRVIGNAVPPLLYQKIIKPLVEVIQPERIAE